MPSIFLSTDRVEVAREDGSALRPIALWDGFRDAIAFFIREFKQQRF